MSRRDLPPPGALSLYFAYGSNMSSGRLIGRVGPVVVVGPARLAGYRHRFSKRGVDGTGKGNIEPQRDAWTAGVVYRLEPSQLDVLVGYEPGYRRLRVGVTLRGDERWLDVTTFTASTIVEGLRPTEDYLAHYRAAAAEHGLDRELAPNFGIKSER